VEAGVYAPSGANLQTCRFLIIDKPSDVQRIAKYRVSWPYITKVPKGGIIKYAPALICVFSDTRIEMRSWSRHNGGVWEQLAPQDAAAAIENMLLMAHAKNMGACWVSAYQNMALTSCLSGWTWGDVLKGHNVPPHFIIQGMIMLGYHAEPWRGEVKHQGKPVKRRPVNEYVIGGST